MGEVALRPLEDGDLDALFELMRDPESVRMAAFVAEDPDDRAAFDAHQARIRARADVTNRVVTLDGRLVGSIAAFVIEGDTEVTYWIDRSVWGAGHRRAGTRPAARAGSRPAAVRPRRQRQRGVAAGVAAGRVRGRRHRHRVRQRAARRDRGNHPAARMIVNITALIDPAHHTAGRRLAWVAAGLDLRPLGTAFLWIPVAGDVAELDIQVHPAERRAGVGSQLLEAAAGSAAEEGMRRLRTEAVAQASDGEHFCRAHQLRPVLALTYTRLSLGGDRTAGRPAPGYRLVHWDGTVPGDLAATFAHARKAMDDMPMGETAGIPQPWTVERLHAVAAAVAGRGEHLVTTAVLDADGEIAGFTELVVPGDGTGDAQHYGTGVLPAHRGRGLAGWMKAEQIHRVRDRFPGLAGLVADTADDNAAMRRVNHALGYRPTHRSALYERRLSRS
ncbi:GNAT family N-acetyltransferase [Paractinoplanes maris]|uniref:GNAT family N-acetyltransferase n=1 Tax=Paractinoplanes maris TaxID=1734446 RepID=UPI00201FB9B5|nr:GNAT family N-acetyltransferase [Actinoplanes maris]